MNHDPESQLYDWLTQNTVPFMPHSGETATADLMVMHGSGATAREAKRLADSLRRRLGDQLNLRLSICPLSTLRSVAVADELAKVAGHACMVICLVQGEDELPPGLFQLFPHFDRTEPAGGRCFAFLQMIQRGHGNGSGTNRLFLGEMAETAQMDYLCANIETPAEITPPWFTKPPSNRTDPTVNASSQEWRDQPPHQFDRLPMFTIFPYSRTREHT